MLASSTLALLCHQPVPGPALLLSPRLRLSSSTQMARSCTRQSLATHRQNCPFRMITIRIAPRVNPYGSQRYKFPYRTPHSQPLHWSNQTSRFLFNALRGSPRNPLLRHAIRDSLSPAHCALWRARQATSSNRLQCAGAPDRSQYEPAWRQSTRQSPA